jgi:type IV pilus assembly protein PilC
VGTFAYKVRDSEGKVLEGTIDAEETIAVSNRLKELGYVPLAIEEQKSSALKADITIPWLSSRIKLKDVAIFSRQFATMINSGLSLLRTLTVLAEQTENQALAKVAEDVGNDVEKGEALSVALARHPKVFDRLYVSMVRAGETGGVLDTVLVQLADTIEKQVALRQKVKSAMTYPVAVMGLVVVILIGMLLFVVPMFEKMYGELGGSLPAPTQLLINISNIVKTFFPVLVVAAVLFGVGFKKWTATEPGRARWDKIKLRIPVMGGLVHKTAVTRFARTLESLLSAGVPILEALEITSETVDNWVMEQAVLDVQTRVKAGESMYVPMGDHAIFPGMVTQMVAVGEETGAVDTMLAKVAEFYEREVEATVDALTSLLEPLLIVVLGGTIGGMVVALYMPMFNIINLIE